MGRAIKIIKLLCTALALAALAACARGPQLYSATIFDLFDSYVSVKIYAASQEEFDSHTGIIRNRMEELHKKYDIYNNYSGVNNLKTVNDNAGLAPVQIDVDVMALLKFGKLAYEETGGAVNIALGPVLKIWHDYRDRGLDNPEAAELPPLDLLLEAKALCGIDGLILDEEKSTAFLTTPGMSLDVGALAKGFAAGIAVEDAKAAGMSSAIIDAGGNIIAVGAPLGGPRDMWSVGVRDPESPASLADTIYLSDSAVVTSGDYQRFYTVAGREYNHIIDPETLMPAEIHAAVTVVAEDSALADMLSTCLFVLPVEQGRAILERYGGEALWIAHDGGKTATERYGAMSENLN